jgi:predicted site-specific integrase-resolvase
MNGTWVRTKKASQFFGIHPDTLRRWADNNLVEYKRTINNQRLYNISNKNVSTCNTTENVSNKNSYIYVRVSSNKQKDDLQRQSDFLLSKYPTFRIIKDIGSGLNFKRKGLLKLLDLSDKGLVDKVVVASKDRLCRFGYDLIKWQFEKSNVELLVLDQSDKSPEQEFTEDVLAILQVFACRWNGSRKYSIKNKKNSFEINIDSNKNVKRVERRLSI